MLDLPERSYSKDPVTAMRILHCLLPCVFICAFLGILAPFLSITNEANAATISISSLGIVMFDDGLACRKSKPGKVKKVKSKGTQVFVEKFIPLSSKVSGKLKKQFDVASTRCKSLGKTEVLYVDTTLKKSCTGTTYAVGSRKCGKSKKGALGVRTLKEAVRRAGPGDRVLLRKGIYKESIRLTVSGLPGADLRIENYAGELPQFDGQGLRTTAIEIVASNIVISGVVFANHALNTKLGTIAVSAGTGVKLSFLQLVNNAGGVTVGENASTVLIERNLIHDNNSAGIHIDGDRSHIVRYNILFRLSGAGVESYFGDAETPNLIHHNIVAKNNLGFLIFSTISQITHNLFFDNPSGGVLGDGGFFVKNNALVSNGPNVYLGSSNLIASSLAQAGYQAFNLPNKSLASVTVDETYSNILGQFAQSFSPTLGSSLINAGEPLSNVLPDLLGIMPSGAPDIGPFEFNSAPDNNGVGGSNGGGPGNGNGGTATPTATSSPTGIATTTPTVTATATITPTATPTLPPEPSPPSGIVAPATSLYYTTNFLFTGSNPVQVGVAPGVIKPERIAVLRGKVLDRQNNPLAGVTISIADLSEFGTTVSRASGLFDLAVNGGAELVVQYRKAGYLPVDRAVKTTWRNFSNVNEIVMIPLDPAATSVNLPTNTQVSVARGSVQTDAAGSRRATILVKPNTTATMKLPGGSQQPLNTITIRATEYTVGGNGPKAMPGALPPTSAYTYAVELSIDEAEAAGAETITFNQAMPYYVENFLDFPVGRVVPAGFYDKSKGAWIAGPNGRVVKVLSNSGGSAVLDVTGAGVPASGTQLAELGITAIELASVASLYQVNQELWRVPIQHFTPWDFNWPYGPPPGAKPPQQKPPKNDDHENPEKPCKVSGSIIECESQVLGESIPIAGTNFSLNYSSERVPGRLSSRRLSIPLSGSTLPPNLIRIDLKINVAGKEFLQNFASQPNQNYTYVWDGKDVYGNTIFGSTAAVVSVGYVYQAQYFESDSGFSASFGQTTGVPMSGNPALQEIVLWQVTNTKLSNFDSAQSAIGGWAISPVHNYVADGATLYLGDGTKRNANANVSSMITTVGSPLGSEVHAGDGGPASEASMDAIRNTYGPDGSLYISTGNHRVRVVTPDGIINTLAGNGLPGYSGDGGPATSAKVGDPYVLTTDAKGNVYVASAQRIRKIGTNGIISTIAGTGNYVQFGNEVPASSASFAYISSLRFAADGTLYVLEQYLVVSSSGVILFAGDTLLRAIDPAGIIRTVAGGGTSFAEGIPALQHKFGSAEDMAIAPNGEIYIATRAPYKIWKIGTDGLVTTFAGTGAYGFSGDGGPATQAEFSHPHSIAFNEAGEMFVADGNNRRVRKISTDGIITTVVGGGTNPAPSAYSGSAPAKASDIYPISVAINRNGEVCHIELYGPYNRCTGATFPSFSSGITAIASEDGSQLFTFNSVGRHLQTINSLTGAILYQFSYSPSGRLTTIVDGNGNTTTINYDAQDKPISIIAPFGQITLLETDSNGYLSKITDPTTAEYNITYSPSGLMLSMSDPNSNVHTFGYDSEGRLILDADPASGVQTLARSNMASGFSVRRSTGLGRNTDYVLNTTINGDIVRTVTRPDGTIVQNTAASNETTTTTLPSGMISTVKKGPDPRFGMQAPLAKSFSKSSPAGLLLQGTTTRAVTLSNPIDPLSIQTVNTQVTINAQTFSELYTAATNSSVLTSPLGRTVTKTFDSLGRLLSLTVPGFHALVYHYDSFGRLDYVSQGTGSAERRASISYNPQSYADTVVDPLLQTTSFSYDLVGRLTQQALPNGEQIGFGYDPSGNLSTLSPPQTQPHTFQYSPLNFESVYTPPAVSGIQNPATNYIYSPDRELIGIQRPDGSSITFNYHAVSGKLQSVVSPFGTLSYAYHPTNGLLTGITSPSAVTLGYLYDGALPTVESYTGPVLGSVTRGYDNFFRTSSLRVAPLTAINFGYDNDGLLTQAGAMQLARHPQSGVLTGTTLGASTESYSYNNFSEVSDYTARYLSTPQYLAHYDYDKLGRIFDKSETILGGQPNFYNYSYDLNGRLSQVRLNGVLESTYTYSPNGNRLTHTNAFGTKNAAYDAQDRLISYGPSTYTYSDNGELESKTTGSQVTNYSYDVYGNLLSFGLPNGNTIEYVIDGRNRRVGKKLNGNFVQKFLYQDGLRPFAELNAAGAVVSLFIYGNRYNTPSYIIKNNIVYRVVTDQLGSPRLIVRVSNGSVAQRMDYDEFGNVTLDTNPGFQPFGFAGGLYDRDSKLTRFGARDYDAEVGRWTSKDPIRFAGGDSNLYGYVLGDPVNFVDPEGLVSLEICVMGGVGGCLAVGFDASGYFFEGLIGVGFQAGASFSPDAFSGAPGNSGYLGIGCNISGNLGPLEAKAGVRRTLNLYKNNEGYSSDISQQPVNNLGVTSGFGIKLGGAAGFVVGKGGIQF
jgi:RHS repeat-associated protein